MVKYPGSVATENATGCAWSTWHHPQGVKEKEKKREGPDVSPKIFSITLTCFVPTNPANEPDGMEACGLDRPRFFASTAVVPHSCVHRRQLRRSCCTRSPSGLERQAVRRYHSLGRFVRIMQLGPAGVPLRAVSAAQRPDQFYSLHRSSFYPSARRRRSEGRVGCAVRPRPSALELGGLRTRSGSCARRPIRRAGKLSVWLPGSAARPPNRFGRTDRASRRSQVPGFRACSRRLPSASPFHFRSRGQE